MDKSSRHLRAVTQVAISRIEEQPKRRRSSETADLNL